MNKEQLLAIGLDDATAEKVLALEASDASELTRLKESLALRDEQIKSLKKFEGDNTELTKRVDALMEENRKTQAKHQAEMLEEKKKFAVKSALLQRENKPHDTDVALRLLDLSSLGVDSQGNITGANELCEKFATERPYLFNVPSQPEKTGINIHSASKKAEKAETETKSIGARLGQARMQREAGLNKVLNGA